MSFEAQYKIVVADDHPVVRRGIAQLLAEAPELVVAGEAPDGSALLSMIQSDAWHAVIMDLNMPGLNGIDLLRQIHAIHPGLPVLILTVQPEDSYAQRLLQAGAAGFLTKCSLGDELVNAVRKVCTGGRYVSQTLAEQIVMSRIAVGDVAPHDSLSNREFEVLRLMGSGLTSTQISEKLCLSVKTVSTYRSRILRKMQMGTNSELIRYAINAHLVP